MPLTTLEAKTIDDEAEDLSGLSHFLVDLKGCGTTVVLFWDLKDGRYLNVRGFHGVGGIGHVNFNSLMDTVPDGLPGVVAAQPLIRVFIGPRDGSPSALRAIKERLDAEMARLGYAYFLRTFHQGATLRLVRSNGSHQVEA